MNGQALAPEPDEEQVVVPATVAGQRLDSYLAEALRDTGLSRTRLARALKAGAVRLAPTTTNPQPLSAAYRLRGNETLLLRTGLLRTDLLHPETPAASNNDPQNQAAAHSLAPRILYEDEAVIVLDKPAGMVVHPAVGNPAGTLLPRTPRARQNPQPANPWRTCPSPRQRHQRRLGRRPHAPSRNPPCPPIRRPHHRATLSGFGLRRTHTRRRTH